MTDAAESSGQVVDDRRVALAGRFTSFDRDIGADTTCLLSRATEMGLSLELGLPSNPTGRRHIDDRR